MGILNLTPDSFFDGGQHNQLFSAIKHTAKMLTEGADIIDVGGASSRPEAKLLTPQEEMDRVLPVIEKIIASFPDVVLSIDTYNSQTADEALSLGVAIVNDISAGEMDEKMIDVVAKHKCPFIINHMQGTPQTMQQNPHYEDVVAEIIHYLSEKIRTLHSKNITDIIIDPGFGFGKTIEQNYDLLKHLEVFKNTLEIPLLVGLSRKSMLYKPLGITPQECLPATDAAHVIALQKGVDIIRVHDVKAAKQVIEVLGMVN